MSITGIKSFLLGAKEEDKFSRTFNCLIRDVDLLSFNQTVLEKLPDESGCYFWIMVDRENSYKIYLGRTRSVQKRITDYSNSFQIHAPNDFKLQFFQSFMQNEFPGSRLDLYFVSIPLNECNSSETELVRRYHPLINTRLSATNAERKVVQDAFQKYYYSIFHRKVTGDA